MVWLPLLAYGFAGMALTNAIPHLVAGLMGQPFQTPFAKPPGEGLSSSTVNLVWGAFNIAIGYGLLSRVGRFDIANPVHAACIGLGLLLIGVPLARHFGRFHGGNGPQT